jgi:hypothetical protein
MILVVIDDGKTFVVAEGMSTARKGPRCAYTPGEWFDADTCDTTGRHRKEACRKLRGSLFCGPGPSTLAERETSMSAVVHQVVAALHGHVVATLGLQSTQAESAVNAAFFSEYEGLISTLNGSDSRTIFVENTRFESRPEGFECSVPFRELTGSMINLNHGEYFKVRSASVPPQLGLRLTFVSASLSSAGVVPRAHRNDVSAGERHAWQENTPPRRPTM